MTRGAADSTLERLELVLGEHLGFAFEDDRREQLVLAAGARQRELGLADLDGYIERLRSPAFRSDEVGRLAETLTVTETFFYRNVDQIHAFIETVFPDRALHGTQRLRVLSAGCASGEEPYSLAIALREAIPGLEAYDVQILGVDVNRSMLARAARGVYSRWALRATPEVIRARYFKESGNEFVLDPSIKRMVTLREQNLAEQDPLFFRALACDVIFCRNVIMYFTPDSMRRVVGRLTDALLPGGYLFLGHAETLRGLAHGYHLCHTHNTFYYQRRETAAPALRPRAALVDETSQLSTLPAVVDDTSSWFEAIQRATHRVAELTSSKPGRSIPQVENEHDSQPTKNPALAPVLELMQRERFADARALLETLPPETHRRPDALLFSAVLFTNDGRLVDAEQACERLLAADELNAGAHYLKALCREHAGDHDGALEHDRMAVHLDSTFAMPHLHAGLLAKRAGDSLRARRELGQALVLLDREDTSRLVLFGGGFAREALIALCRTELAKVGGSG